VDRNGHVDLTALAGRCFAGGDAVLGSGQTAKTGLLQPDTSVAELVSVWAHVARDRVLRDLRCRRAGSFPIWAVGGRGSGVMPTLVRSRRISWAVQAGSAR